MSDSLRSYLRRQQRWRAAEMLPWLLALSAFGLFPDYLAFGAQVLVMILFALSLDLLLGYAGVVTLGHAAFFGAGAYAAGMASAHLGWNEPLSALLLAGMMGAVLGFFAGLVLMRYHGLTLLMLTLATAILLQELANVNEHYTGGFDGLLGIRFDPLLGRFEYDLWGRTHYAYALAVLFIMFCLIRRLVYSPFGQSLIGIRENRQRMNAIGAPVYWRLVWIYTIAAGIAGIAGGLFAQVNAFVTLDVLSFNRSGTILIMLILGGAGRLYGAFWGVALFMVLEDQLARLSPEFWQFGVGLVLVLIVLFGRGGVIGLLDRIMRYWRRGVAR